jgi:hypothetical protein
VPRLPRRPSAPRPRGAVGNLAAGLARRRASREPRVVLRDQAGHPRSLPPGDPVADTLLAAADRLISAAQRGSDS